MIISYTEKFIFFHISKVAGLSIRESLKNYVEEPEKFKINRPAKMLGDKPNPIYEMWSWSIVHAKARDAKKELPKDIYDKFYKFAFVRNPWDWQVSMYHFILKEVNDCKFNHVKSMTFEEYLEWVVNTDNPFPKGTPKFQKDLICDYDGQLIVDFVGRYEKLEQDFNYICQVLNLNTSLPHLNSTKHRDYGSYYTEKTKKMIGDHFREDIELFGYKFDGYDSEFAQVGQISANVPRRLLEVAGVAGG